MELAKVTSKGQITIPVAVRQKLDIRAGDKILFTEEDGKVVITNASNDKLIKLQKAFEGIAQELDLKDEQDVVNLVKEIRAIRKIPDE